MLNRYIPIVAVILALLTASASAQLWHWSDTPSNNATIDPSINFSEGQPPSSLNDSARATMAGIGLWRDDSSGLVTLGGTSTAYTATTNQGNQSGGISSLVAGYRLCFAPNVVSGAGPTLAIDSQAAKPIHKAPNIALVGGELQIGVPYCVTYFTSSGGEYILNGNPGASTITNSMGTNTSLSTVSYTTGPTIAQGTTGTWFASGTVTISTTHSGGDLIACKLWDGTTVMASTQFVLFTNGADIAIPLSGYLASPAGNINIACEASNAGGTFRFNDSGNSKDSTLSAFRIQ